MARPIKPKGIAGKIPIYCEHSAIWPLSKFKPNPRNPNTHPDEQIKRLGAIIAGQGWRNPIVVSKRSGLVVKGHGRLESALAGGMKFAPVDLQDYANAESEHADMLADNRLAELAETDEALMAEMLKELQAAKWDMDLTGFDAESIAEMLSESTGVDGKTLAERFGVPPFSVLDARQGYWQARKRAWLSLGIQSELGRGGNEATKQRSNNKSGGNETNPKKQDCSPGGSPRPACDYSKRQRGDGKGRAIG